MLAKRMRRSRTTSCCVAAEAGLRDARRGRRGEDEVLGLDAAEQRAYGERAAGGEAIERRHPLRQRRLVARPGPASEPAPRQRQQRHAEHDLEDGDEGAGTAGVGRFGGVGHDQRDAADDGHGEQPAAQERRTVRPGPRRRQDQDHGDDRQGADGDADRQREHLTDRAAHGPPPAAVVEGASVGGHVNPIVCAGVTFSGAPAPPLPESLRPRPRRLSADSQMSSGTTVDRHHP